jgi:hypothetical protein
MPNFNISTEQALAAVREDGLYKMPNFLDQNEIAKLKEEMAGAFSKMSTGDEWCYPDETSKSYPFGKICRVMGHDLHNFPVIVGTFNHAWFSSFADTYFQCPNQQMLQVFFSHEYLKPDDVEGVTRNSVLHVDPYEALKYMIYINDCDENNGAFRYIKGSHLDGCQARTSHDVGSLMGDKYRLDQNPDLASKYSENDVTYASGSSGSLLIFTTDIIHGGGILKQENAERMAIICHNRRK